MFSKKKTECRVCGYDIDTNSYKYSGIAIFDCAPAIGEAIVKLVKASA